MKDAMIIAVDFDGTLYEGHTPFPEVNPLFLNVRLIRAIERAQQARPQDEYILWTCREDESLTEAMNALKQVSNIRWDAINDNVESVKNRFGNSRKIVANIYIDDCSMNPAYAVSYLESLERE